LFLVWLAIEQLQKRDVMSGKPSLLFKLSESERRDLKSMTEPTMQYRYVQRAKVILMAVDGMTNKDIMDETGLSNVIVCKWKKRFIEKRLEGLKDLQRSGPPPLYSQEDILELINTACSKPDVPYTHWSMRRLAEASDTGMKKTRVHEILKSLDLKPHQYRMWLFPSIDDPEFERRELEICGLYVNPPENSVVLCIDEKPAIQALERPHASELMRNAIRKIDFHYKRHGVLNLFAAFSVNDGKVYGKTSDKRKSPDFLEFLKDVHSRWSSPTRELHIIVDNYGTHTSHLVTEWIKAHPEIKLHFTPTHASWLNQIELWFSILYRQALQRGDFKSKDDLAHKLVEFIEDYNRRARPFAWTYKARPLTIS
jgi:putative transposase